MASPYAPRVHFLSNGTYHVTVDDDAKSRSTWKSLAVLRWHEDAYAGGSGNFCYLRDEASGAVWSATTLPVFDHEDVCESTFSPGLASFYRRHALAGGDVAVAVDIAVAPDADLEVRRIRISNHAAKSITLGITSYSEVVLQAANVDATHPAFEKLFVQTEVLPELQTILCTRRAREPDEPTPWMFHLLLPGVEPAALASRPVSYETDRMRFIGRGRSTACPLALDTDAALSGTHGAVLDPIAAIRCGLTMAAGQTQVVDLITGIASTREECLALVARCREPGFADLTRAAAVAFAHADIVQCSNTPTELALSGQLAACVLEVNASQRAAPGVVAANRLGQSGLWRYAISGDLPIVWLGIDDAAQLDVLQQLVRVHDYWRRHGLTVDLVVVMTRSETEQPGLLAQALAITTSIGAAPPAGMRGGVFVLAGETMPQSDFALMQSVARLVIHAKDGLPLHGLPADLGAVELPVAQTTQHVTPASVEVRTQTSAGPATGLAFDNGLGGFSADGREYVITVSPGHMTPVPWINVLANPSFGSLVSESGSASSWSENAQQFRLTPWSNDPICDPNTEAFYIRDEDSGAFWSPTLLPAPSSADAVYVARHGFGYSVFGHNAHGIESELTMFVAIDAPVKFVMLRLLNTSPVTRRLSATGYVEWVLGDDRRNTAMYVGTEVDAACSALFARNTYSTDFAGRTAFFDVDLSTEVGLQTHSICGDRASFIGGHSSLSAPLGMSQPRLCGTLGFALDPCAAIRVPVDLAAGQEAVLVFRLGAGTSADEARQLAQRWRGFAAALQALEAVRQHWAHTLGAVQVQTPDRSLNILANGWLVYQTLSCRLWARTAFYQASGAYGFRDQLQDVMALVHAEPALVREHLLRSAARQFPEGDVQHWWHPQSGRGIRTRCSDDFLWLPLATARYVRVTGDKAVLDERVHFVEQPQLRDGEVSSYALPEPTEQAESLYEHCRRAIEHGLRFGAHGLPLMGSCDWNDGMNLVGVQGKGESVWLGFFLYQALGSFAKLAQQRGDDALAAHCLTEAARLAAAIDDKGWDGQWYQRGWFDDGSPLGTAGNTECRIDSIAQSWAVLSGAGDPQRARQAMQSVDSMLVDRDAALVRLLDPPFERSSPSPGYIQGYVRGVRENGGQYTHAAVWAAMAFATLGDGRRAWELFGMLNPIRHAATAQAAGVYKIEPYVVAGDVYSLAPHAGRGGWSWYTGAAGWLYRFVLESLLGVTVEAGLLRVSPQLPDDWNSFKLSYRFGQTGYDITVMRAPTAAAGQQGVEGVTLDGVPQPEAAIRMVNDRHPHSVEVRV
jgi:cellobiose phosphorylase